MIPNIVQSWIKIFSNTTKRAKIITLKIPWVTQNFLYPDSPLYNKMIKTVTSSKLWMLVWLIYIRRESLQRSPNLQRNFFPSVSLMWILQTNRWYIINNIIVCLVLVLYQPDLLVKSIVVQIQKRHSFINSTTKKCNFRSNNRSRKELEGSTLKLIVEVIRVCKTVAKILAVWS